MTETSRNVRWGVLGTARIADTVGKAIADAEGAELLAIGSRTAEKAAAWAEERNVSRHYGCYEAVLDDPDIDAVYIPLPPSMHAQWTIRAAERGKHVLCEKPLAATVQQAEEMAAACQQHNVQLMDGVMWMHHPRTMQMHEPITNGTLGYLQRVTSAFSIKWKFPNDDLRMQRDLGGGSLLDLGWYCARATLWAFGDIPQRVYGAGIYENDVDVRFNALLWFDEDQVASFDCGFGMTMRRWLEVAGTEASLVCDDFTKPWNPERPRFWLHGASGRVSEERSEPKIQEVCMIERFNGIVRSGQVESGWTQNAIATQLICEALDRSARGGEVVEIR